MFRLRIAEANLFLNLRSGFLVFGDNQLQPLDLFIKVGYANDGHSQR